MSDKPDNPPAFPVAVPHNWSMYQDGMTLRDYFAGQALVGIITHPYGSAGQWTDAAEQAYAAADAMLEAREQSK